MSYERISDAEYAKLLFQTRSQYVGILNAFRCYGLDPHVTQAIEECVKVAENFGMIVRGKEIQVHIMNEPKPTAI